MKYFIFSFALLALCVSTINGATITPDSLQHLRQLADQGNARAQCNLGWCYETGNGVTKDYSQAVYWYRKSADQGEATAQRNLGLCYEDGKGVTKDRAQAISWYRKAANQGNNKAKNDLNRLLNPTADDIKAAGSYASAVELKDDNTKYWKVSKNGRYGLTDAEGKVIVPTEMDALESAGTGYLRYKLNGFWGVMNYAGKIIIDTDRGYTSIGDFKTFNKRFAYTMAGYKGECDATGRQISKIKVDTPRQNTSVASSSSSSSSNGSSSSNSNSGNNSTTIHVEHHRDPVPVQVWKQCIICGGSGKCQTCGGTGIFKGWSGNSTICEYGCGGSGKCSFCAGHGGHYEVEYR